MGHLVRMPALDPEMERGTVLEWSVDADESVSAGERVAAVGSETTTGAAIAREDGVLRRRLVAAGESVSPGTPIGIVAAPDADVDDLEAEATAVLEDATENAGDEHPRMPGRTVTASTTGRMRGQIRAGVFEWRYDEPDEQGGTETGPTPVDVFLAGLAACLSLSVRFQAEKRDAAVGEISVTADATPDRGPVEELAATIRLESDEDDATVERIVDLAERGCHVSQLLREDRRPDVAWEK